MVDENSVKVINNENIGINLEIMAYENRVSVDFTESVESAFSVHNTDESAHNSRFLQLKNELVEQIAQKENITDVNSALSLKADVSTIYNKTEIDSKLGGKIDISDASVTKMGNEFNGVNQLVMLNSSGKLPSIDGSLLSAVPSTVANTSLNNINTVAKSYVSSLGLPNYFVSNIGFLANTIYQAQTDIFIIANGAATSANGEMYIAIGPTYSAVTYFAAHFIPKVVGGRALLTVIVPKNVYFKVGTSEFTASTLLYMPLKGAA